MRTRLAGLAVGVLVALGLATPGHAEIRALIVEKRTAEEIAAVAVSQGMRRLRDDGLSKVRAGKTSMSELLRVLGTTA